MLIIVLFWSGVTQWCKRVNFLVSKFGVRARLELRKEFGLRLTAKKLWYNLGASLKGGWTQVPWKHLRTSFWDISKNPCSAHIYGQLPVRFWALKLRLTHPVHLFNTLTKNLPSGAAVHLPPYLVILRLKKNSYLLIQILTLRKKCLRNLSKFYNIKIHFQVSRYQQTKHSLSVFLFFLHELLMVLHDLKWQLAHLPPLDQIVFQKMLMRFSII